MRRLLRSGAAGLMGAVFLAAPLRGAALTSEGPAEPAGTLTAALDSTRAGAPQDDAVRDPATSALRFYQSWLSALRHGRCRFSPSCSQYAIEAIRTYGALEGSARAADRLMRCSRSARRFYSRGPDGLLDDPVGVASVGPARLRLPAWLLPPPTPDIVPGGDDTTEVATRRMERILEAKSFAASLAAEGDCERAATEYRRAAHLAGERSWHRWAFQRSGDCYFAGEDWPSAEKEYAAAAMQPGTAQERGLPCTMAAACQFDQGDFDACERLLADCGEALPHRSGLLGLCRMARGSWEGARARFAEAAGATTDRQERARFERLAAWSERGPALPRRSARLATTLSAVLPGAGQIYAGRVQVGLRQLVTNGALIWTIVKLTRDDHWPAAYLVTGIELPFYMGNVIGAGAAAREFDAAGRLRLVTRAIEDTRR